MSYNDSSLERSISIENALVILNDNESGRVYTIDEAKTILEMLHKLASLAIKTRPEQLESIRLATEKEGNAS